MNLSRRLLIELALVALVLLYLTGWSVLRLIDQRRAARQAAADLAECRTLALRIEQLKEAAPLADEREREAAEVSRLVESAARAAGLDPAQSLVRVAPESPRRVGETQYTEAPTQVVLRRVTLGQLVQLLGRTCAPGTGLRATGLRLTAPRDEDEADADRWLAEVTLTQLVFSPRDERRSSDR